MLLLFLSLMTSTLPTNGEKLWCRMRTERKLAHSQFPEKFSAVSIRNGLVIRGGSKDDRGWDPNQSNDQWASYRRFDQDSRQESNQYRDHRGYDEAYDDYRGHETNRQVSDQPYSSITSFPSSISTVFKRGDRKIGLALLGSGAAISLLGVTLFFNKALMRLGNLLIIAGIPITIGPSTTLGYFMKPEKIRATSCLLFGIFLVFVGHPMLGIAFEIFGLLNLFGNMFPMILFLAKQMPIFGTLFQDSGTNKSQPKTRETPSWNEFEPNDYFDSTHNRRDTGGDSQFER